jgi:hypothetical protein
LASRNLYPSAPASPQLVEIRTPEKVNVIDELLSNKGQLAALPATEITEKARARLKLKGFKIVECPPVRMFFLNLNAKKPPFLNKAFRQSIRDMFLYLLSKDKVFSGQVKADASFIPRGGIGYLPFKIPNISPKPRMFGRQGENRQVSVMLRPLPGKTSNDYGVIVSAERAMCESLKKHGLKPQIERLGPKEWYKKIYVDEAYDVTLRGSGILVVASFADLRMMFMSKIGACIPDPSGHIPELIKIAENETEPKKRKRIAEEINASIYEEASVITFRHSGLTYVHSPSVDIAQFNLFQDPIEFRAVNWRP